MITERFIRVVSKYLSNNTSQGAEKIARVVGLLES